MKNLRPICFLVFFSYVQCQTLQRSLLAAALNHTNSQNYLQENLRDITSIMVAQFLQKSTYQEVQTIVEELVDRAEKCKVLKPQESPSECSHQLMTTFLEHVCNNQGMADKQEFSDCCNVNNKARLKCFLLYKKDDTEYSDVFQIPNLEQICEVDKENQASVKERYIYETSRKHPFLYGPTILTMSACYETAIRSCCQEENKTECFQIKLEPIRKYVREISLRHHHLCEIGIKFNHKVSKAVELVLLTKKQPKANFSEIAKLAGDVQNLHQTCCEGDVVACVLGRSQLMNDICSKQSTLSSKITPCCALSVPFRGECIINSENDDKPDLSSLPLSRFTEDRFVCKQFIDKQDDLLPEFLYEYSRRHSELAVSVILRVYTVYQNLLGKCCKLENPLECYSHGKEMFQRVVGESHEHIKNHCDLREKLGDANFHDRLIILYTKKVPQLSAQELVTFTKNMAAAATKCCPLRDEQRFVCMEDSAKLILGALCRRHEAEPINPGVGHCCEDSYAFRKPCFDDLQVDRTYISPPLSCDQVISLKEDLCKAREEQFQTEKQKLLSNLVKQKPRATEMQFQSIIADFAHLVETCCQAEESEMCFRGEGSKLIEKCQSLLGHK
ncbi:alpha-fetoprotein-like isoform X1 [Prionailurus bengalensis]|uniref:alpha-fetoprotein-like isoform X1 n=2 Tax=Prionailurus bengalensis TaxID=37029 RepID=UPI001CA866E5|nr:alpha-fetoprotein-like isoform X1 [Prionailurus bengalensis]XP_043428423.1 alpha-fetoprotein-like isoform X1 [Prionailurus bengalensis]